MKKIVLATLAFCSLILVLTGCGKNNQESKTQEPTRNSSTTNSTAQTQTYTLPVEFTFDTLTYSKGIADPDAEYGGKNRHELNSNQINDLNKIFKKYEWKLNNTEEENYEYEGESYSIYNSKDSVSVIKMAYFYKSVSGTGILVKIRGDNNYEYSAIYYTSSELFKDIEKFFSDNFGNVQ